jgi:proline iminopeptidase
MICPIDQALSLNQQWGTSQLKIINNAGHAISESGIRDALVDCCKQMLEILS